MDWNCYGDHIINSFERKLSPEDLRLTLYKYREEIGDSFSIHDLIQIYSIQSKIQIAAAIVDAPEFLMDQIGKADGAEVFEKIKAIGDGLSEIAEAIRLKEDTNDN